MVMVYPYKTISQKGNIMKLLGFLKRFIQASPNGPLPTSMQSMRGSDPCWCGSGKKYRFCHRRSDRRQLKQALKSKTVHTCSAFG